MSTYVSKQDLVLELVRDAISKGSIVPGQYLRQEELAKRLGVSSTPVREALRQLEAEGIVVRAPHKGVRVAEVSAEDAREIYFMRSILESELTKLAVPSLSAADLTKLEKLQRQMENALAAGRLRSLRKINGEFHMTIYKPANMWRSYQAVVGLWTQFPWDTLWVIPGRAQVSLEEHEGILLAIQNRDAELAGVRVKQHIESSANSVIEHVRRDAGSKQP